MKNSHFKTIAAALLVTAIALNSCEKDVTEFETEQNESVVTGGLEKNPVVIDGKKMEWQFSLRPRKLAKGMLLDETDWYSSYALEALRDEYGDDYKLVDTLRFSYRNQNYEIKLLRVDRKSEPGKYFYVMIDNLAVKIDTACWAYADDESYVDKYGRLYTWNAANALAPNIKMSLPVYDINNPTQKKFGGKLYLPVKARLLNRQDVCDIIECNAIGAFPETGYTIDDQSENWVGHTQYEIPLFYYDVFIGGLEGPNLGESIDYSRGERSLAGYRNTVHQSVGFGKWDNGWFGYLNEIGLFWLDEQEFPVTNAHYPLSILPEENKDFTAFINCHCNNQFGYSVRYVFEPQYK